MWKTLHVLFVNFGVIHGKESKLLSFQLNKANSNKQNEQALQLQHHLHPEWK